MTRETCEKGATWTDWIPTSSCLSRAVIPLCVAAAFGLVVFVDELLEFIEFG
mgnify:CR=1 FL=1